MVNSFCKTYSTKLFRSWHSGLIWACLIVRFLRSISRWRHPTFDVGFVESSSEQQLKTERTIQRLQRKHINNGEHLLITCKPRIRSGNVDVVWSIFKIMSTKFFLCDVFVLPRISVNLPNMQDNAKKQTLVSLQELNLLYDSKSSHNLQAIRQQYTIYSNGVNVVSIRRDLRSKAHHHKTWWIVVSNRNIRSCPQGFSFFLSGIRSSHLTRLIKSSLVVRTFTPWNGSWCQQSSATRTRHHPRRARLRRESCLHWSSIMLECSLFILFMFELQQKTNRVRSMISSSTTLNAAVVS